jgi:uncharacterized protein involved in exopolysaccharide biosynthesis
MSPTERSATEVRPPRSDISVADYLRALWSVRAWFAGCVIGFVAVAALWAWQAPRVFEATATLRLMGAVDPGGERRPPIAAAATLLRNNELAADAIAQFGLDKPPYELTPTTMFDQTVIVRETAPDLLFVSARLRDGKRAAELANHLAEAAVRAGASLGVDEAARELEQLTRKLGVARERLEQSERQLVASRRDARIELLEKKGDPALDEREVAEARLQIEYQAAAAVYGDLFARHEQAGIAAAAGGDALRIVERAFPPATPVQPRPTVLLAAGLALGVIAGAMVGLIKLLASSAERRSNPSDGAQGLSG